MAVTKFVVSVLAIACNLFYAINCHSQEAASIVEQRSDYLRMEADLWNSFENGVDQASMLKKILFDHKSFADAFLNGNEFEQMDFSLFTKIYEWDELSNRLVPLRSLYNSFQPILDKNVAKIDRIELEDLASTVVDEVKLINETMDSIENIMVKQGTYHKVQLVCNCVFFISTNIGAILETF